MILKLLTLAYLAWSRLAFDDGDYPESLGLAVKARESARSQDPALGQAPLFLHASATQMTDDYDQAAALFEQNLALNRKINDQGMVRAELQNLGLVEFHRGNFDTAEHYFAESERLGPEDDSYSMAMASLYAAFIAFGRGNKNESRTLLERAQSILKEAKMNAGSDDQFEINWLSGQLRNDSTEKH